MIGVEYKRVSVINEHVLKHQAKYNNKLIKNVLTIKRKSDRSLKENTS